MQNHIQFHQSPPSNMPPNSKPYPTHPPFKIFDKTLPSNPSKYQSNLNFSVQSLNPKNTSYTPESNMQSGTAINRNIEFRSNLPYGMHGNNSSHSTTGSLTNIPNTSNHAHHRHARNSQMARSLIISQSEVNQVSPEEHFPQKRQFLNRNPNAPRRAYRMSETNMDDAPPMPFHKQEEIVSHTKTNTTPTKDINFMKVKTESDQKQVEQKKQLTPRSIPPFLAKNQMKRSIMESMEIKIKEAKQIIRHNKKVSAADFIKVKELGNGKYGRVYLVRERYTGFICALKVIEKKLLHQEQITDQFIRQLKIQTFLSHPNIIKMYGFFDDATNIYIILEVGTGGQLYHHLKKSQNMSEQKIALIMKQICDAVNQIHSLRIIHRDIKPQNIVLHDNIIKLCDFGWSVHQDNKLRTTFCGTPLYVCPQILKGKEYDEKIDIWSIGIMMYEMVVGENPFKITKEQELIKIVKDEIKIPSYVYVSPEVRDFLDKCLMKNPNDRANIKQLINHSFFKKHQEKPSEKKLIME